MSEETYGHTRSQNVLTFDKLRESDIPDELLEEVYLHSNNGEESIEIVYHPTSEQGPYISVFSWYRDEVRFNNILNTLAMIMEEEPEGEGNMDHSGISGKIYLKEPSTQREIGSILKMAAEKFNISSYFLSASFSDVPKGIKDSGLPTGKLNYLN